MSILHSCVAMLCCIMLGICSVSCDRSEANSDGSIKDNDIENLMVNNAPISTSCNKYSITELQDYFVGFSDIRAVYGKQLNLRSLRDVNAKFPVEYLRERTRKDVEIKTYYVVYPVTEGGLYIVYLTPTINDECELYDYVCLDTAYLWDLPSLEDFQNIQINDNYTKVKELAPATILVSIMSSRIISYSYLENGNILEIEYNQHIVDESYELTVKSMNEIENGSADRLISCDYEYVFSAD